MHESLKNTSLFRGLPEEEIKQILDNSTERHFEHEQIIFQKGDRADSLFIVQRGEIRIITSSMEGKEVSLNTIQEGDVVGEIALIDGGERSASAIAIGSCTLLSIRYKKIIPLLDKYPTISTELLSILSKKVRDTSDRVETVGLLPVSVSLAKFLLEAGEKIGQAYSAGLFLDLKKSQHEIGIELGTSRESINRQLNIWKKKGIIKLGGQNLSITLLDIDTLDKIANGIP